ncbi:MAG: DUF7450 family protein [Hyphomicrobiaceae bacterium]
MSISFLRLTKHVSFTLIFLQAVTAFGASAQDLRKQNHFLCHEAVHAVENPIAEIRVVDQFGSLQAFVARIVRLCNPADKNREGIPNKDYHLVCYEIKPGKWDRKDVNTVVVSNQFGEFKFDIKKELTLCVPSKKQDVG